jgi:acetyl-CoA carboxylase biotin carboxyl carrier protein
MNENHVLSIIEIFSRSDIAEVEITEGNFRMMLRKGSASANRPQVMNVSGQTPEAAFPAGGESEDAGRGMVHLGLPASADGSETISSPIVGTFYASPGPDAPPFVGPGSRVKAGDSLCILEAMKMMNHLDAEADCEIVRVLVSNGELVEYGQALFEIRRT